VSIALWREAQTATTYMVLCAPQDHAIMGQVMSQGGLWCSCTEQGPSGCSHHIKGFSTSPSQQYFTHPCQSMDLRFNAFHSFAYWISIMRWLASTTHIWLVMVCGFLCAHAGWQEMLTTTHLGHQSDREKLIIKVLKSVKILLILLLI
jgi:hypothetical protein